MPFVSAPASCGGGASSRNQLGKLRANEGFPRSAAPCPRDPSKPRDLDRRPRSRQCPRKTKSMSCPGSLRQTSTSERSSTNHIMRYLVRLDGTPENSKRTTTRLVGSALRSILLRMPHSSSAGSRSPRFTRSRPCVSPYTRISRRAAWPIPSVMN